MLKAPASIAFMSTMDIPRISQFIHGSVFSFYITQVALDFDADHKYEPIFPLAISLLVVNFSLLTVPYPSSVKFITASKVPITAYMHEATTNTSVILWTMCNEAAHTKSAAR